MSQHGITGSEGNGSVSQACFEGAPSMPLLGFGNWRNIRWRHVLAGNVGVQRGDFVGGGIARPKEHQWDGDHEGEEEHITPIVLTKGRDNEAGRQAA
ncbi:hypothetical protein D3C85_1434660 [compost metagenome]